jgi:hypothetical protein
MALERNMGRAMLCVMAMVLAIPVAVLGQGEPLGGVPTPKKDNPPRVRPAPNAVKQGAGVQPVNRNDVPEPTVKLKEGEVPAIKFDTPTYDFGRVRVGQDIKHDFWFTNTGTGPLELMKVKPSCGCTQAGGHDKIVQPGESGKIPIKLNPGRASGPIAKTILVHTNVEGEGSQVTLHIKGEVWHPIQATPASASFGRLTQDMAKTTTMERRLTIVNNTEASIELTGARCTNPSFKATSNVLEPGKRFELVISIVPPLANGPVTGSVEVDTTLADSPKVTIPVNAYVTADVDVTPNQLTLTGNRAGKMQRQFFIRNNTLNPVKISELSASNEALQLTLVETQPVGKSYRLTVDIPVDYEVPEAGDTINFKTDNLSVPDVTIPITASNLGRNVAQQFQFDPKAEKTVGPAAPGAVVKPAVATGEKPGEGAAKPAAGDTKPTGKQQ